MLITSREDLRQTEVSEPGADRGPRAGSPRGVVVATGSNSQVDFAIRSLPLLVLTLGAQVL